jgi:DNA-binding MarR family transcriptional regulator
MRWRCSVRRAHDGLGGRAGSGDVAPVRRTSDDARVVGRLSLSALLAHALVAFTIEFDDEFERQMPHRTAKDRGSAHQPGAAWLVSQVMWANVMRFVDADGTRVDDLHERARTARDSLAGLQRWGYVTVDPQPTGGRGRALAGDAVVRPTAAGRRAQEVWRPLAGEIEERWRARFGAAVVDGLRDALQPIVTLLEVDLPDYLPIVYPTMNGKTEIPRPRARPSASPADRGRRDPDLSVLVAQVLLAFTLDFERASELSLPISANELRVLDGTGVRLRDLAALTGVSKEANAMSLGFLVRHSYAVVEPDPSATRGKVVRLTPKGRQAQREHLRLLGAIEADWQERFGDERVAALRDRLERLVGEPGAATSPLLDGLRHHPDGWRSSVRGRIVLPDSPVVLHRGGFPDGS